MPYDPKRHGPRRIVGPGFHEQVFAVVCEIPAGAVATYGDVAGRLGSRGVARQVGYALAAIPESRTDVPWHRVVGAGGRLSARGEGGYSPTQRRLLEEEGVPVSDAGRIRDFEVRRAVL